MSNYDTLQKKPVFFTIKPDHIEVTLAHNNGQGFCYSAQLDEEGDLALSRAAVRAAAAMKKMRVQVRKSNMASLRAQRRAITKELRELA